MEPEELQAAVDERVRACLDLYARLCRPCQAGQLMVSASGVAVEQLDYVATTTRLDKARDSYKILARGYWECAVGRHPEGADVKSEEADRQRRAAALKEAREHVRTVPTGYAPGSSGHQSALQAGERVLAEVRVARYLLGEHGT